MEKFAISTLTSRNKIGFLTDLVNSMEGLPKFPWYIYSNGSDEKQEQFLKSPFITDRCIVKFGQENKGVGYGINQAAEMVKHYKYTLFIEDDWYHLPVGLTGYKISWLYDCIDYLDENPDVDGIVLRKYIWRSEVSMHNHHLAFNSETDKIIKYQGIKIITTNFDYANSPHIRRNKSCYEKGIFPQIEHPEETKPVGANWAGNIPDKIAGHFGSEGQAVQKGKENGLKFVGLLNGIFTHEYDSKKWKNKDLGCGEYSVGESTCKYGFFDREDVFCQVCSNKEDLTYYKEHFERFYQLLDLYDNNKQNAISYIRSKIKEEDSTMDLKFEHSHFTTKKRGV